MKVILIKILYLEIRKTHSTVLRLSQLKGLSRSSIHLQRLGNGKPATEFLAHAQPVPRL